MKDKKKKLSALINNESFLRWLRGTSSPEEANKWRKWYSESIYNQKLTQKAKKIISMPFENPTVSVEELDSELERFDEHFLRLIKVKDF